MALSRPPSQPTLRPFDVAVALHLLLEPEARYEPLAEAMATSTSAVHRSVARLQAAGLLRSASRTVARPSLREFLLHGVRYAFPLVRGPETVGIETAWSHDDVAAMLARGGDGEIRKPVVWPEPGGTVRGEAITPLFAGVARAVAHDPRLHALLAAVDAIRGGNATARRIVGEALAERILWVAPSAAAPSSAPSAASSSAPSSAMSGALSDAMTPGASTPTA